eukprot:SAG22_NODE_17_length_32684_cov_34.234095_1_plen_67_part_00
MEVYMADVVDLTGEPEVIDLTDEPEAKRQDGFLYSNLHQKPPLTFSQPYLSNLSCNIRIVYYLFKY